VKDSVRNNIFISFIEECIMNPQYKGFVGGRIEVSYPKDVYPSEEIRFFTYKVKEFNAFRDEYDMKHINPDMLKAIRQIVRLYFLQV